MYRRDQFLDNTLQGGSSGRPLGGYTSVVRSNGPEQVQSAPPTAYLRKTSESRAEHATVNHEYNRRGLQHHSVVSPTVELTLMGLFVKPWAYKWLIVLVVGFIASLALYGLAQVAPSIQSRLLYAVAMSVCVPAAVCCLFLEWDITCRAKWHSVLLVAVVGGCISASLAECLNAYFDITLDNAKMAALTEEPTKGLMLIVLLFFVKRFPGILSGLALGCAVGAGFAVCETVEYAYAYGDGPIPSVEVLALRGALSPLMHMAWTSVLGGALWAARGVSSNWRGVLLSWPVWVVFMGMMMFHAIWNSVGLVNLLVFVLWGLLLYYVRRGVYQAFANNLVRKEGVK